METPLNTSEEVREAVSEKKIGRLHDLHTPVLRGVLASDDQAQALIESAHYLKSYRKLVARFTEVLASPTYKVPVDYKLEHREMIDAGKYDFVNLNFFNRGQAFNGRAGRSTIKVVLVRAGELTTVHAAGMLLNDLGIRSLTIRELFALGIAHPNLQRKIPIVSLETYYGDIVRLGYYYKGRGLHLDDTKSPGFSLLDDVHIAGVQLQ